MPLAAVEKPRVLMIAFACNPAGGGEHWLGWGWAEQAAKSYDVTLVTWDRFSREIERCAPEAGITPVFVGVPSAINWVGDRSGSGRWLRQMVWHRRAMKEIRGLHAARPFALVHQTTFHTFRLPFRAASMGIPSVWGPIAGGETTPPGFGKWLGRLSGPEAIRGKFNRLALANPRVQNALKATRVLFVSNRTTLNFLPDWCREKCLIVPPNTVRGELPPPPSRQREAGKPLELLFVGNCVATRAMPIVFEALKRQASLPWRLTVVGGGSSLSEWITLAARLGFADRTKFTGPVPRAALEQHYANADVFVFPALRDSGGSGLLEAMSCGLPVVCCNWGGPAEMVDEDSGIRVSVENPEAAIFGFASAFERLHLDPVWRLRLGQNAFERARQNFSWAHKRVLLETTYDRCLGASR